MYSKCSWHSFPYI